VNLSRLPLRMLVWFTPKEMIRLRFSEECTSGLVNASIAALPGMVTR
jgi:hypothetical protein